MAVNYVPRVTQLDAVQLDSQVEELFKVQLEYATKFFQPGILQPVLPEINLLLRSWLFKYSLWNKKATFGQEMLSMFYKQENFTRSKLLWYYGYAVALKYIKERALYSFTTNVKVQNILNKLETFQVIGDILNFLSFIQTGRHPTLIDFILGLEISAEKLTREDLSDLSWTRELLWNNFIELIGTVILLMNLFGAKARLSNLLRYNWWKTKKKQTSIGGQAVLKINTVCSYCSNKPVIPHTMGCPHVFCYYCITANKAEDKNFSCPQCSYVGESVTKVTAELVNESA